jgi:uncharacterized protein (TIGR02596 family)
MNHEMNHLQRCSAPTGGRTLRTSAPRCDTGDTGAARAFSLIEMLIVVSVVGILLAFAAPQLFSLVQSTSLTSEGTAIRNRMSQAQQIALSQNTDVEVRFFKMKDEGNAEIETAYRGFQFYRYNEYGQLLPVSQFFRIRPPIVINEPLSTLVEGNSSGTNFLSPTKGTAPIPVVSDLQTFEYVSFRFKPDGSTDLPGRAKGGGDTWYITLTKGLPTDSKVPNNYFTVQLDPFNGRVTSYRP